MRLFFVILYSALILTSADSFAQATNYNSPKYHQKRFVPKNQYSNTDRNYSKNSSYYTNNDSSYFDNENFEFNATIKNGYQLSELQWNIAGDLAGDGVSNPNIISELTWVDVEGYKIEPSIEYLQKSGMLKGLHIGASVNKSFTFSGKNQDSDFSANNRGGEFSRSINDSDSGHSSGFSADIGYAFDFTGNRQQTIARFTTLVGYAIQKQEFTMSNGVQIIPATGPFPNLDSRYEVEWRSPFVGMEFTAFMGGGKHIFKSTGKFFKTDYYGTGNWNLRSDFAHPKSFEDEADGYGYMIGIEYGWKFYPQWQLSLSSNYSYLKAEDGLSETYFSNGAMVQTKFNQVEWQAIDYMAGITYNF